MNTKILVLALAATALGFASDAQDRVDQPTRDPLVAGSSWTLRDESEGTRIYEKELAGQGIVALRGETRLEASLERVVAVLANYEARTEWVDRLASAHIIERRSKRDFVVYERYALPWPLDDRDFVFRATARTLPSGALLIELESVTHSKAPATCGVRGELQASIALARVPGRSATRIAMEVVGDPKGWLPTWLINMVQSSWPIKTFAGIRAQLEKRRSEPLPSDLGLLESPSKAAPAASPLSAPATSQPSAGRRLP